MKVISIWQLQGDLYSFRNKTGEFSIVNTKTHKIVFSFKLIDIPDQVDFKFPDGVVITCTK